MVQLLLSHLDNKNLVNVPDKNGLNPLIYAVKGENMPLVELLVREKYVNLDHQDKDKNTSMHYSVIQQKYELIDLLVDSGANIDAQNADGQTPLMVAAKAGDDKLTDYLLDYGVNKKLRDRAGLTALQLAEASGNRRCVELIRENRPVKANAAKDMRARQDNSAKEAATSSNGQQLSEKRFEKLFEGGAERNVDDGSDTSRILSEEKNAQSNRLDTWADSDSDDEVDSDDMVEFKKKLNNMENGVNNLNNLLLIDNYI
jgi:ankyrin repeat protein